MKPIPLGRHSWRLKLLSFLAIGSFAATVAADAQTEYEHLLTRIPDDANALLLLDVESIFQSPKAQAENWKQTYGDAFAATPVIVPPNAQRFVQGAAVEIDTMEPLWEVASMKLSVDPSINEIQQRIGGVTDTISGVDALWPRENLCIVKFAAGEFGVISPANRQSASRWIRRAQRQQTTEHTPYLRQAVRYASASGPEIIMAIDLDQILRPEAIRQAVDQADFLQPFDAAQLVNIFASLRGVTLGVRVTDQIYGKLLVDFGRDATPLKPVAKELILSVLQATGAMLDEFNDWQAQVDGRRISLEGPLSSEGMRRLFSLVTLDAAVLSRSKSTDSQPTPAIDNSPRPPAPTSPARPAAQPTSQQDVMAAASYRYFNSITRYLNDLQRPRRSEDLADIALWINNFARKIERLPTFNVDPELTNYGQEVAYSLRDAVGYLHGIDQRIAERQSQVRPKSNITIGALPTARVVNYGGYYRIREYVPFAKANVDIASALDEQDKIAEEEYQAGTDAARQIMEHLKSETGNIRQVMSQRYGREF